jgi:hypothetical protein
MLNQRREAAMKVAASLWAAEDAIDAALAKAAEFSGTLVAARTEANLSAVVGQDAFEVSASAFAALARARADIVEAHRRLSETRIQVGLRNVAVGDEAPKVVTGEGDRHLKAVA